MGVRLPPLALQWACWAEIKDEDAGVMQLVVGLCRYTLVRQPYPRTKRTIFFFGGPDDRTRHLASGVVRVFWQQLVNITRRVYKARVFHQTSCQPNRIGGRLFPRRFLFGILSYAEF